MPLRPIAEFVKEVNCGNCQWQADFFCSNPTSPQFKLHSKLNNNWCYLHVFREFQPLMIRRVRTLRCL
jgi:hypothetical protein